MLASISALSIQYKRQDLSKLTQEFLFFASVGFQELSQCLRAFDGLSLEARNK